MVQTNTAANLGGAAAIGDLRPFAPHDAAQPQRFGDFSSFQASPLVSLGQATASIDPAHAARQVAGFLLEG